MTTTVLIYRSGQTYTLQAPPNVNDIAQAEGGAIFNYFDAEKSSTYQYVVVEYPKGKAVSPYDGSNINPILRYESGQEYPIAAYPHIDTMDEGALFRWGELRMIAVEIGGRLFIESYQEELPSWPIGSIWSAPSQTGQEIDVNWLDVTQWDAGNIENWSQGTGNFAYRNFAGINGLTLEIFRSKVIFAPQSSFPRIVDNGFEFTVEQGNASDFLFRFLTPVRIEDVSIEVESADRTLTRLSGPFRLDTSRHPRYPNPQITSVDLFGPTNPNRESFFDELGIPTSPVIGPGRLPPLSFKLDEVSNGFSIFIDNRRFSSSTTIRFINWKIKKIDLGSLYKVEFDAVEGGYSGRPLIGGSNVVLTDQHVNGGWIQLEDSVFGMDYAPDEFYSKTLGYNKGESVWGTINDTLFWCIDDTVDNAKWVDQKAIVLSHPFQDLNITTYDPSTTESQRFDDENKGLYFNRGRILAARFIDDATLLSVFHDNRSTSVLPIPSINLSIDDNDRTSILLDTGTVGQSIVRQKYSFVLTAYDSVADRPTSGANLINVARINGVYYVIVFDGAGNILADKNGADFTTNQAYLNFANAWLPFVAQGINPTGSSLDYFYHETLLYLDLSPFGNEELLGITLKTSGIPVDGSIPQGDGGMISLIPGVGRGSERSCGDVLLEFAEGSNQARTGSLVFDFKTTTNSQFVRFPNAFPSANTVLQVRSTVTNSDGSQTAQMVFTPARALQGDWVVSTAGVLLAPPAGRPATGSRYLIVDKSGTTPAGVATGVWANHDGEIAEFNGFNWDFVEIARPTLVWDESEDKAYIVRPDGTFDLITQEAPQPTQQIVRSENLPTVSTTKPTWEEWIQETATSLRKFTHGLVGTEYIPLPIPWYSTYNAQQNKMVPHYELLKPAATP